jgi:hypothetical protein
MRRTYLSRGAVWVPLARPPNVVARRNIRGASDPGISGWIVARTLIRSVPCQVTPVWTNTPG